MLNKWHVYNDLVEHYQATGEVMGHEDFHRRFSGRIFPREAIEGLYEFDRFLEKHRGAILS
jgi:hypothetical protein